MTRIIPAHWWFGMAAVVLLLMVAFAGYWGMFGLPRPRRPRVLYRARRRHRWWRRDQVRPAELPAARGPELDDDYARVLPPTLPPMVALTVEPYRWPATRRDPLVTCLRCTKSTVDCRCHEEVLSR